MTDPIPNLYDKYGGTTAVIKVVQEFSTSLLTHPSVRHYFDSMPTTRVAALNLELVAFALGKPATNYSATQQRPGYASLKLSLHAYEEIISILRSTLLNRGFQSRDAVIAINVLDMHAESLLDVRIGRKVTSPFAGVDRRRLPRDPKTTGPSQRRDG